MMGRLQLLHQPPPLIPVLFCPWLLPWLLWHSWCSLWWVCIDCAGREIQAHRKTEMISLSLIKRVWSCSLLKPSLMSLASTWHRGKPRTDSVMDPPYTWAINMLNLQLLNSKGGKEKKSRGTNPNFQSPHQATPAACPSKEMTYHNLIESCRVLEIPCLRCRKSNDSSFQGHFYEELWPLSPDRWAPRRHSIAEFRVSR